MYKNLKAMFGGRASGAGEGGIPGLSQRDISRLTALAKKSPAVGRVIGVLLDALNNNGFRDRLTGLHNRYYFEERITEEINRIQRHSPRKRAGEMDKEKKGALLFIDLDGFKALNDTHGHLAGDAVLKAVAATLDRKTRDHEPVARYGGDEFMVFLVDDTNEAFPYAAMARLQAAIENLEVPYKGRTLKAGASIGFVLVSKETLQIYPTIETLLEEADRNMYRAKQSRKTAAGLSAGPN